MLICIWHLYLWIHWLDLWIAVSEKAIHLYLPLQVSGAHEQKTKNRILLTGSTLANFSSVSLSLPSRIVFDSSFLFSYSNFLVPEWKQWLLLLKHSHSKPLFWWGVVHALSPSALSLLLGSYNSQQTMPPWRWSDAGDMREANMMCDLVQSDSFL